MGRVQDKVCLVTGGGSGLGRADVLALAREGARVVITDIDQKGGEETAQQAGCNAIFIEHDVAERSQWERVIARTLDHFGELNVVVNNAGMVRPGNVETCSWDDYQLHQRIHMDGTYLGLKYGIETIKRNGKPGSIINMASTTALMGYKEVFAYAACKGAVRSMTNAAAIHCQQEGYRIRVNCLLPGVIVTPLVLGLRAQTTGEASQIQQNPVETKPGPGLGEPMDVGNTVLFLASDESKFINGAELRIDNAACVNPAPL
ncbi:SDR family oxidoreductase [Iodidimonas sp. SYSU 1G8]|uniref:SDR family oxidoreductase n=1 Tax=Iodidimonas sp. SYSU 1G8 TaxID=3133967 RepID=UPI0031FEEF7E